MPPPFLAFLSPRPSRRPLRGIAEWIVLLAILFLHADAAAEVLPSLQIGPEASPKIAVQWTDPTNTWTLETSRDLTAWGHLDASGYERPPTGGFKFTDDPGAASFFRLRKLGSTSIYVVGDSISTSATWPTKLANLTGRHTFTQAIGGTTSPSMVNRARGVELVFPLTTPTSPGITRMTWCRHIADRTNSLTYKTQWAALAKSVSEPSALEVYQNGRFLGLAKRSLKSFTTDHANSPQTIFCPGHGFNLGDRVVFISNDPAYPANLSVLDSTANWSFSSANLPSAVVERRVYFAANVTTDTLELKELAADTATIDLGSNSRGSPSIECGWTFDVNYTDGAVTWKARTPYDDRIWVLEVSANDIPISPATTLTIPNTLLLLRQMTEINPRFILVCPPSGSFTDRGPGTFNWTNYYDTYMPWVKENYPGNHVDTMALLDANRTQKELGLLLNPTTPERLWLAGTPGDQTTWQVFRVATTGAHETWIGPGYTPLQYRGNFNDDIHLSSAGYQAIATAVSALITQKGW